MPETVPRWLLAAAGIVILVIILVEVKDFAARKSAASPSSATSGAMIVHSDAKSIPQKKSSRKRARTSAAEIADSAAQLAGDGLEKPSIMAGIVQAGARAPFVPEEGAKRPEPETVGNRITAVGTKCSPLPNSTRPGDVDVRYYQNWAKEYGCGLH